MTARDLALDPATIFVHSPLTLYRITRFKYANLSGEGAAKSPGRWNTHGQEAIYTCTNLGATVLERLVHTPKDRIPQDLALITLHLAGAWNRQGTSVRDHATGGLFQAFPSLDEAETSDIPALARQSDYPLAVAVPSVIVPVWNVVLFPHAPGFWHHASIHSVESFDFDPRLFPDNAILDPGKKS